jgi:prolyl-tRNA synthetase
MYWSKTFIPTLKESPKEAESVSHQLMLRAGCVRMLMAGVYSYLPLGLRVLNNIKGIIRQEMNSCGASELLLPALQPLELWQKTGRDKDIGEVMVRFTDRRGRSVCLGPTHEEVITELVKSYVSSYRQLPLVLYQIQTKFRDEVRPRFGLVRSCEFIMKDAYSFDRDEKGLEENYCLMYEAYKKIFKRCGLESMICEADPGIMGGNASHEFMVPASEGEDIVAACPQCHCARTLKEDEASPCPKCKTASSKINCIEVGHTFKLGTKYSASLGANFLDGQGALKPIVMGCYGIGVSRLVSAVIAQNNDKDGIIWPRELAPFEAIVLPLDITDKKIAQLAEEVYGALRKMNKEVLLDDRDERAGVKFKDADLIGVPLQVIIGKDSLKAGNLELKMRSGGKKFIGKKEDILKEVERGACG